MNHFKRFTAVVLCLLLITGTVACGKKNSNANKENSAEYLSGVYIADIDIANYGDIIIALNADIAPATVTNFVSLISEGFYDGLTFHRIIDGFMMQGGDPTGQGTGGSGKQIVGEFSANGFDNSLSHVRGTVSMARNKNYDSASSQFFIVQQDSTHLDGNYAAFGTVLSGMEIVDQICSSTPVTDENGTVAKENQPVINSIKLISYDNESSPSEEEEQEAPARLAATINFDFVTSTDGIPTVDHWKLNEGGEKYLISSSEELLSIALYRANWENVELTDQDHLLFSYDCLGSKENILLELTLPEGIIELVLVAYDHNEAVGKYIILNDGVTGSAYLVPYLN